MKVGQVWTTHHLLLQSEIEGLHRHLEEHPEDEKICEELVESTKKSMAKIINIDKEKDKITVRLGYIDLKTLTMTRGSELKYDRERFLMLWEKDWSLNEDW